MPFAVTRNYRRALFIVSLCAGCVVLPVPHVRAEDNAALIERARLANDNRQFDRAREDLAVVLARSPWNEGALLEQARLLYFERKPEDAWRQVAVLLGEYPQNAAAHNLRALLNVEWKQDPSAALADLASAVQHDPTFAKAFGNRARILHTLGRHSEALGDADMALSLDPENAHFRWTRAHIYVGLNQPQKALADFDAAIERDAGNARFLADRAWLRFSLIKRKTETEALAALKADIDHVLQLDPDQPKALLLRGLHRLQTQPRDVATNAASFDDFLRAYRWMRDDPYLRKGLRLTNYSQFEPGADPIPIHQILDGVKERFVGSGYALPEFHTLEWAFSLYPEKEQAKSPTEYELKAYLEMKLRHFPGNARLLYYVHAGTGTPAAEQAMLAISRDYDRSKDAPFAALAAVDLSKTLRMRANSMPEKEKSRLYKEAGEWLMKALEFDPNSAVVKREVAQFHEQTKTMMTEREAKARAAEAMVAQFQALTKRFENQRHSDAASDATAAQHMEKAKEALRGGPANWENLRMSKRWQQMAFDAKRYSMMGVNGLEKDLLAFRDGYPNAPREMRDWVNQALNYLGHKQSEFSDIESMLK